MPPTGDPPRLNAGHLALVAMLLFVSVCEGFDISLTSVVLPFAGREFHADPVVMGHALSVVGLGSIASWLLIRLADRFGRRPILILAALGFGLCSLVTMLAATIAEYAAIQTVARLLMVTQVTLGYLVLSETLPPALRGRANGLLGAGGSIGAALPFLLLGAAAASPLGWRALFLIGGAPLLAVPFLIWRLRETQAHVPILASSRHAIGELCALVTPALRRQFAAMSALWFIINFSSGASGLFFTLHVMQERHWPAADLAWLAPGIVTGALLGNVLAGLVMDLLGRRAAFGLFLVMAGGFAQLCYLATGWWTIALAWIGVQASFGVWVIGFTVNAELFPAHLRAAAAAWCNSLIGRWGMVAAPVALGALTHRLGAIGTAASLLAFVAYLGLPIVWLLPETRDASLAPREPDIG